MCTGQNSVHFELNQSTAHALQKNITHIGLLSCLVGQVITTERLLGTVLLYRQAMLCTSHSLDHMTDHVIMIAHVVMIMMHTISIFLHSLTLMLHGLSMRLE